MSLLRQGYCQILHYIFPGMVFNLRDDWGRVCSYKVVATTSVHICYVILSLVKLPRTCIIFNMVMDPDPQWKASWAGSSTNEPNATHQNSLVLARYSKMFPRFCTKISSSNTATGRKCGADFLPARPREQIQRFFLDGPKPRPPKIWWEFTADMIMRLDESETGGACAATGLTCLLSWQNHLTIKHHEVLH